MLEKGGMEARLIEEGDRGICGKVSGCTGGTVLISSNVLLASYLDQSLLL